MVLRNSWWSIVSDVTGMGGDTMKQSISTYCGECERDFKAGEIVHFAWIENRSFCSDCQRKLKPKISEWEERYIPYSYSVPVEMALERLKEELEMFGENNQMITVRRTDLDLIVKVMERGE